MTASPEASGKGNRGLGPLREKAFRRIWLASLLSSLGQLVFSVAVAWEMTRLSDAPTMIALVQTAMMLPLTIVTLPAGALADMFDRRKIAMFGLGFSAISAATLAVAAFLGLASPWALLAACMLVGTGTALYLPAWQASIAEMVSRDNLPSAVGLSSLSANVARSIGPAIGGLIILAAGAKVAFMLTASFFIPLLLAYYLWDRQHIASRLPPERIDRAIASGMRYALHAPVIRTVLIRIFIFALIIAPGPALAPLVAKDVLAGDALTLGILLGAQGIGAVLAAMFVGRIRKVLCTETAVRTLTLGSGLALEAIGFSQSIAVSTLAFFIFGICYITTMATLNVDIQMSASRWVVARAVSLYASATFVGLGLGAWIWGRIAEIYGIGHAFEAAGLIAIVSIALGYALPLRTPGSKEQSEASNDTNPEVSMDLNLRSGPIVVEVMYDVDPANAREFYAAVLQLQPVRHRIGGYNWSIARDVSNPAHWTERFQCSTWGDYLRMLDRYSEADMESQLRVNLYHCRDETPDIIRKLERPFGSVRWKAGSFDAQEEMIRYLGPLGPA